MEIAMASGGQRYAPIMQTSTYHSKCIAGVSFFAPLTAMFFLIFLGHSEKPNTNHKTIAWMLGAKWNII